MAKTVNAKGRSLGASRHIRIYHFEFNSIAFQALSPNEKAVYLAIRARYNGRNNGYISFSAREAGAACHASVNTGARALNRLVKLQFLKIGKDSSFGQKRLAREYELTAISKTPAKPERFLAGTLEFMRLSQNDIKALDQKSSKSGDEKGI